MPTYFFHAEGRLPGGRQPPIRITHFEFNAQSQGLTFEAATEIELQLMAKLLKAGYKKVNGVYPGTYEESQRQERFAEERERDGNPKTADTYLAANMKRLRMQTEALKEKEESKKKVKEESKEDSPPQSPKGSLTPRDTDVMNSDNTPIRPGPPLPADATDPRRRLSEPQPYTGTLGLGLDISPMRPASGSRAIPIKDPKTKMYSTPTKQGKRASFAVDTIHEENENEDQ